MDKKRTSCRSTCGVRSLHHVHVLSIPSKQRIQPNFFSLLSARHANYSLYPGTCLANGLVLALKKAGKLIKSRDLISYRIYTNDLT